MGAIAKGEITITTVNDAYTVSLSPETCVINADFSGNPYNLSSIAPTLTIKRGDRTIPFSIVNFHANQCIVRPSVPNMNSTYDTVRFLFTRILNGALSGGFEVEIKTEDGYDFRTSVQFTFSVVRESTMLDWIQDWNDNMTRIAGSYILTPKIFIGKRENVLETVEEEGADSYTEVTQWKEGALTGVYIGPDLLASGESSAGIYGYLQSNEIFHLNADGGLIAGWSFNHDGLYSPATNSGAAIQILSEGSIISRDDTTTHWGLFADGSASFANGNVTFQSNGNASFNGTITANSGIIGGWKIEEVGLYNGAMLIDAANKYIGIAANANWNSSQTGHEIEPNATNHRNWVEDTGGIALYWKSGADYGMIVHSATGKIVQLGTSNLIAGWNIDSTSLYLGTKNNMPGEFTTDGITIGTFGLRGKTWNIDTNGHASFANEKVVFNADGTASISGWTINTTRFSTAHAALVSNSMYSGLFFTPADISEVGDMSLVSTVNHNGGIYIYSDSANSLMRARDNNGNTCFFLSTTGYNTIGNWSFDNLSIYNGSTAVDDNGFVGQNSILLSTQGLRGNKWKFLADGSGAIAGGNIQWSSDGTVTFAEGVTLTWANISGAIGNKLTKIDANGIYTGTISADNVTAGSIIGSNIQSNNSKWAINNNGDGYLASRNIEWDAAGNVNFKGDISIHTLRYYITPDDLDNDRYNGDGSVVHDSFIVVALGGEHDYTLPHLDVDEYRVIKLFVSLVSRSGGFVKLMVEGANDSIVVGPHLLNTTHYQELNMSELENVGLGYFELIGRGGSNSTVWHIIKLSD